MNLQASDKPMVVGLVMGGMARAFEMAADVAELQRLKIMADSTDPSWTEHLAEVRMKCRELARRALDQVDDPAEREYAERLGK